MHSVMLPLLSLWRSVARTGALLLLWSLDLTVKNTKNLIRNVISDYGMHRENIHLRIVMDQNTANVEDVRAVR